MSYTQFGYPYTTTTQLLVSSSPSSSVIPGIISSINNNNSSSSSISNNTSTTNTNNNNTGIIISPCYDNGVNRNTNSAPADGSAGSTPGSRVGAGPASPASAGPPPATVATPAAVCCSPYNNRLLASAARGDLTALGVYGGSYAAAAAAQGYGNYVPYGTEPSAFYSPLTSPYEIKDSNGSLHTGLPQTTSYYHYDGALNQYQYGRYGGVDLSAGTRRKNATRETTATLKAWLYEHRKNPYPTKGEKIMLAIITKMTLTQVSTWFANARRRLKKENKMTWSPRSRPGEESGGKDDCRREIDHEEDEQEAATVDKRGGGVVKCFVAEHNGEKERAKAGHILSDLEDLDEVDSDNLGDDENEDDAHLQEKRFHKSQCKSYPALAAVDSSINTSSVAAASSNVTSNASTNNNNNGNHSGGGISINNIIGGGNGGAQPNSEGIKSSFALSCGEQQDALQLYETAEQQQHQPHHHHHHHQLHQSASVGAKSLLPLVSEKPRIWSLAHTVSSSCDSKYPSCAALQHLQQQQLQQQQQQQSPVSGSQATSGSLLQRHQKFQQATQLSQLSPPCSEPVSASWRQVSAARASPEQLLLKAAEQNGLGSYLIAQQQQQQQQQHNQQQQQQQQQQLAQVQHGLLSRASCQMSGLHMATQAHQDLTSAKSQAAAISHRHSAEVDAIRSKIQGTDSVFTWSARP